MTVENIKYETPDHQTVSATIDGITWSGIDLRVVSDLSNKVNAWIAGGGVPADYVAPTAPIPMSATKLGLKRAFSELGQWDNVKAALASNPAAQEEWDLAISVNRSDPITQGMITALGLTEDQVDALLVRANILVQ
jgi:hypothetical protein